MSKHRDNSRDGIASEFKSENEPTNYYLRNNKLIVLAVGFAIFLMVIILNNRVILNSSNEMDKMTERVEALEKKVLVLEKEIKSIRNSRNNK